MTEDTLYFLLTITLSVAAVIIYTIAYKKLEWDFLWVGIAGACLNGVSGIDMVYESINYDDMDLKDYLLDNMWAAGWALEVVCLYMILFKVMEMHSQLKNQ